MKIKPTSVWDMAPGCLVEVETGGGRECTQQLWRIRKREKRGSLNRGEVCSLGVTRAWFCAGRRQTVYSAHPTKPPHRNTVSRVPCAQGRCPSPWPVSAAASGPAAPVDAPHPFWCWVCWTPAGSIAACLPPTPYDTDTSHPM